MAEKSLEYYKLALERILESAANDGWYLWVDDLDDSVSLVASEIRWTEGTQGEESVEIDVPLQEFEDRYCAECKKIGVLHNG